MISAFGIEHGEVSKSWKPTKVRALINIGRSRDQSANGRALRLYAQAKNENLRLSRVNPEYRENMARNVARNKKMAAAVAGRPRRKGTKLP